MSPRDVVITGIGLVSCLGEGNDVHARAFSSGIGAPRIDAERFAPFTVHPLPEIDWNLQIPRRSDQRQMETWQRIGTYTAGLALEDSGIKGNEALCASMDMVIAAGGGERDEAVDDSILQASLTRNDEEMLLNERLTTDLRPTLFLAQLSNLMAGNISIVHKVTGSSRTFMGEEGAGIAAVESAVARIASGQSTHILIGGAMNIEFREALLTYALGGYLHRGAWAPVWEREDQGKGGLVAGSGGAFLVLESREHAEMRGRTPYARIETVVSSRSKRFGDTLTEGVGALLSETGAGPNAPILSGASGAQVATHAEADAVKASGAAVRALPTATGHLKEPQLPFCIGVAALMIQSGQPVQPLSSTEAAWPAEPEAIVATAVGYRSFEGAARIVPAT